jgi:thioredoxin-related protein
VRNVYFRLLLSLAVASLALACQKKMVAEISPAAPAEKFEWLTDFKRAQQEAKAKNKPLLIEFTGSDWCPPCRLMQREVFATPEFQNYAAKNFILLEVDFPQRKELPRELAAQNTELAQKFAVEGFPYIVLLGGDGKKLAERVGYDPGEGAVSFIAWLEKWKG